MDQVKLSYNLDISDQSSWLNVTTPPSVRSSFAYVQELGNFYCGPGYFTTRENLPSYLIKLCLSGEGVLEYGDDVYQVQPGHIFWIDCRKHQNYYTSQEKNNWHSLWVHLYGPTTEAYYNAFLEQNMGSILVGYNPQSPLIGLFNALFGIYGGGSSSFTDDVRASSLLTQLMAGCIETSGKQSGQPRVPDYVTSIQGYIRENYSEEVTLDVLAQYFSMNKYHLQKFFKRYVGMSPNEYLTRTRLDRAKQLLRTTDDPMIAIAHEIGYTPTYFDSVFKKYEGISPKNYRQRWYSADSQTKI